MEKLVSRHSGGGGKLGTLDMQSYLEVMGRQLAEIQAQHHQFYASRQDRIGRLRSQDQPQLMKGWSSDSNSTLKQRAGQTPVDDQAPLIDTHSPEDHTQQSSPSMGSSSVSGAAVESGSSAGQGGARRSLNFPEDSSADSRAGGSAGKSGQAAGIHSSVPVHYGSTGTGGAKPQKDLRAFNSTPPLMDGRSLVDEARSGQSAALAGGASTVGLWRPQSRSRASPGKLAVSSAASVSPSATYTISPSSASVRPQLSTPGTPSTDNARAGAARSGTARHGGTSTDTSPVGPYAVYDASGLASVSYATPETHDGDYPLTASVSSSSQAAWRKSRPATTSATPSPGQQAVSPSTGSVISSAVAVHGRGNHADQGAILEEDGMTYGLALAGQAYDGIDSEEDEDPEPFDQGQSPSADRPATSLQASAHANSVCASGAVGVDPAAGRMAGRVLQPSEGNGRQVGKHAVPNLNMSSAASGSRPQSRSGPRTPLVVASLETEEALRALLATPRFHMGASSAVGASVDGLEVPDDVLAALAKTDGMDLDAALVAAMAAGIREHAGQEQGVSPPARPGIHGLGGQTALAGQGRHPAQGPGALTAAPASAPAGGAARGSDASLRSVSNATGRSAGSHNAAGRSPAAGLPPRGAVPHHQPHTEPPIDASMDADHLDKLSQTIEMPDDIGRVPAGTMRDSAAYSAAAMVAQRVAAQQHAQPVLYSLAPRPVGAGSGGPSEQGSRRTTADGGSRRTSADGGSRRTTADGGAMLDELVSATTAILREEPQVRQQIAARPGSRPTSASVSGAGTAAGHAAGAGASPGRASEAGPVAMSPSKVPRGSANTASPSAASSTARQGGDVDMVLYGSPSHKIVGVDAGASPCVAASPYVPPSPPPGADPSPYMPSPLALQASSRLQRNSRTLQDEVGGSRQGGDPEGPHAGDATATATGFRPWSAAGGSTLSNSRRQLIQPAASGTSSGANSANLDMSLTQAAAAATAGSRPQTGQQATAGVVSSPTGSQRQMRVQPQMLLQVPPVQQQHENLPQPAHSAFSVVGLSPSGRSGLKVASYDLGVDDAGRPMSPSPSKNDITGASTSALNSTTAAANSSVLSQQPQQPVGPPLAAFSRAAAAAAAADVGMQSLQTNADRRPLSASLKAQTAASRAPAADVASVGSATCGSGSGLPHVQEDAHQGDSRSALPGASPLRDADSASVLGDQAAGGSVACSQHSDLGQGQSPFPPSVASSSARLSQLKARRQQQWQSQHGLQGQAADLSLSTLGMSSSQPPQPPGSSSQGQQQSDGGHQHQHGPVPPAAGSGRSRSSAHLQTATAAPMLPEAVAEAIARAGSGRKEMTASGELNLGHGISGLSVAIEAGQVKWAWQTDDKGKHAPGQLDIAGAAASPGASSTGSPWASPAATRGAPGASGSDWAVQQLPAPQWQRHGHVPAGARGSEHEEQAADSKSATQELQRQQSAQRRHSEYSMAERQLAHLLPASLLQHQYAVSAGGSSTPEQPKLRCPSASEAGGQGNSKAMALLRLKRQSIMRHNALGGGTKESDGAPAAQQHEQQQRQQPMPASQPHHASRAGGSGAYQEVQQQQRHASAARVHGSEYGEPRDLGFRAWVPGADEGAAGASDAGDPQAHAKPFLKRRSAKVQARKVDWSHVQPRTNSRNPDYYGDNSPDVILKTRISPLSSPKGGVAKPPLNVNTGARGRKPSGAKLPPTPTAEEKAAAVIAAAKRRMSNIPVAPLPAAASQALPAGAGEDKRGISAGGAVRGPGTAMSPLDDLLAHVNTLLRDFDKMVL